MKYKKIPMEEILTRLYNNEILYVVDKVDKGYSSGSDFSYACLALEEVRVTLGRERNHRWETEDSISFFKLLDCDWYIKEND